jgi:DNA polymerase-3 subunit epsilon
VVLDVESSGLDPSRDRLLAIAAIALHADGHAPAIVLGDSFEVVLRQDVARLPDKTTSCCTALAWVRQRTGMEPAAALQAFEPTWAHRRCWRSMRRSTRR